MAVSALTLAVATLLISWAKRKLLETIYRKRHPYPPGPKPMPLIGNMLDFPAQHAAKVYLEWEKTYNSPLLHAEALGTHVLVINSLDDANALFDRPERAKIYADKPQKPILKLIGWDSINLSIMPYGEEWRQHRKICHQNFNVQAARQYQPVQAKKVRNLLLNLLEKPEQFKDHSKLFSVSLSISAMYGHDVESIEDPCVKLADDALQLGQTLLVPGGSLIDLVPILRHIPEWCPLLPSRKVAAKVNYMTQEVLKITLDHVKESFKSGTVVPSLVTRFYDKKYSFGATQAEEDLIKNVAYTVYGGASDTTTSITITFIYCMAINPDIQRKAQAEIDKVVGSHRLPEFADREVLPYIEAIYQEVLRMWAPLPLGMPHTTSQDDYYKGYFIPKGK
uniref:Cytochrome P450 n=1 Tax=Psilocybe cubensis TaxID=181762 RepID=A0A8H8CI81_PSICU